MAIVAINGWNHLAIAFRGPAPGPYQPARRASDAWVAGYRLPGIGPQLGCSFLPASVNWRRCPPAMSITASCALPPQRVVTNTMCRPLGAMVGLPFSPAPSVRMRITPFGPGEFKSYNPMPNPESVLTVHAMNPSRDHVGRSAS